MKLFSNRSVILLGGMLLVCQMLPSAAQLKRLQLTDSLKITEVWSGHPVDFAFVQRGDSQFVACYDRNRKMTVAVRNVASGEVHSVNLPSTIGWDSHNYIAMAFDSEGYLHVSGNMHSSPLVYFRSTSPGDITTLKSAAMTGSLENSVTYPVFFRGASGELLYMHRDGSSGNGNQIFNKWDMAGKKWTRLFDKALFDGQGQRNAYMGGPLLGPDGYFHVYWMWRETADAATTHDVGHIRSRDLLTWENAAGAKVTLPVTVASKNVLVDVIPEHGGVINRGAVGFDAQQRPIITYHKFDASGNTQLYNARWEGSQWKKYQVSDWAYRWNFGGFGSLVMEISFGPVMLEPSGALTQTYSHVRYGKGIWQLDEATLAPIADLGSSLWPEALENPRKQGMVVHWLRSTGLIGMAGTFLNSTSDPPQDSSTVYALRWETMPENGDQPRSPVPSPTPLMLYTFKDPNVATPVAGKALPQRNCGNAIKLHNGILSTGHSIKGIVTVTVCDLQGRILVRKNLKEKIRLNLRDLAGSGTSVVTAVAAGKTVFRTVIVNAVN